MPSPDAIRRTPPQLPASASQHRPFGAATRFDAWGDHASARNRGVALHERHPRNPFTPVWLAGPAATPLQSSTRFAASVLRPQPAPACRSHSAYASRVSYRPAPLCNTEAIQKVPGTNSSTPFPAHRPAPLVLIPSQHLSNQSTSGLGDSGSPWTPRMTHLRRCAPKHNQQSVGMPSPSEQMDRTPVWPCPWNRDDQPRGKGR